MHSVCFLEHSGTFCMHSGTFCMHSGTFWNILNAFCCTMLYTVAQHCTMLCTVVQGYMLLYRVELWIRISTLPHTHGQTDRHTDIRTCWAASSQLKNWPSGQQNQGRGGSPTCSRSRLSIQSTFIVNVLKQIFPSALLFGLAEELQPKRLLTTF